MDRAVVIDANVEAAIGLAAIPRADRHDVARHMDRYADDVDRVLIDVETLGGE